jgi:hypothetical protein
MLRCSWKHIALEERNAFQRIDLHAEMKEKSKGQNKQLFLNINYEKFEVAAMVVNFSPL